MCIDLQKTKAEDCEYFRVGEDRKERKLHPDRELYLIRKSQYDSVVQDRINESIDKILKQRIDKGDKGKKSRLQSLFELTDRQSLRKMRIEDVDDIRRLYQDFMDALVSGSDTEIACKRRYAEFLRAQGMEKEANDILKSIETVRGEHVKVEMSKTPSCT